MSPERIAREYLAFVPNFPKYSHGAVKRLQHYRDTFDELYKTHHYATTFSTNRILFEAAEKTFLREIERLKNKINRQMVDRRATVKELNSELDLRKTEFTGDLEPRHPLNHYDDRRLTKRGLEICFRLFDLDKSPMAVAHLLGLSLIAIKRRYKQWKALGGKRRLKADLNNLRKRKFYRQSDD
jgi:hypothetical protein